MTARRRAVAGLAAASLVPAAVFAAWVVSLWPFTVDDTFITLRYARHVAAGWGPVWNAGPVRDEGYTSLLWTLVLAVPHLLRLDAEVAAKVLGTIAQLGAFGACFALTGCAVRAADRDAGPWWAFGAAALFALHPASAVHAVSGMETAAFTLALALLAVGAAQALGARPALRPGRLASTALLAGLLRPEGHLVAVVVLATLLVLLAPPERARLLRAVLLGYVLPGVAYLFWRRWYHGTWLPLPFHVKAVHVAAFAGTPRVLDYLRDTFRLIGVPLVLGAIAPPRPLVPALLGAVALVAFGLFPEHVMGFQARYLVPAAPVLFACAGLGLWRAHRWLAAAPSRARLAAPAVLALAGVCAAALASRAPDVLANRRSYAEGLARAHRVLARDLAALPPGRLAISDAGVVPYVTDWPVRDLVGLNDRHIAVTGDHDPAYVFAFAPDVIVLASRDPERFEPFAWNAFEAPLAAAASQHGFRRVRRYRFHDGYWLWLLVDPASPTGAALLARSSAN